MRTRMRALLWTACTSVLLAGTAGGKPASSATTGKAGGNRCVTAALKRLSKYGGPYKDVAARVVARPAIARALSEMLPCSKDLPPSAADAVVYHESIHFLGTAGVFMLDGSAPPLETLSDWRFHSRLSPTGNILIRRIKGLPRNSEIHAKVKEIDFLTSSVRLYLEPSSKTEKNDLYMLLDEWNAYVAQLELTTLLAEKGKGQLMHRDAAGKPTYSADLDDAHRVMEMAVFTKLYLDRLKEKYPAKYEEVMAEKEIRHFILSLVARNNEALGRAKAYSILFIRGKVERMTLLYGEEMEPLVQALSARDEK